MTAIRTRFVSVYLPSLLNLILLLGLLLSPFNVSAATLTSLSVAPQSPVVYPGVPVQLTATGSYDDGTLQVMQGGAKQVSSGVNGGCTLNMNGTVTCWGANSGSSDWHPSQISGITNAVSVGAGYQHSCVALADGRVMCRGANMWGQLGNGTTLDSYVPVQVTGITNAVSVSAGESSSCAVLADGTVKCWGKRALGDGSTNSSPGVPVQVIGITNAASVSQSGFHACAVLADRTVKCWGDNMSGQLGNGSFGLSNNIPVQVSGITNAVTVSAGMNHTCSGLLDGTLKCWGSNSAGQGGYGSGALSSAVPLQVTGISDAMSVSTGWDHSCAALSDGTLKCWGSNSDMQLGNGPGANSPIPVVVNGIINAAKISASSTHTCAVLTDSTVKCWGASSSALGHGDPAYYPYPTQYPYKLNSAQLISNISNISVGYDHTCMLRTDATGNSVSCWGYADSGQLGIPVDCGKAGCYTPSGYHAFPTNVSGLTSPVAISSGYLESCAILIDGTVMCWGKSNSNSGIRYTPQLISGLVNAAGISVGSQHNCAVKSDGTVHCWGLNSSGQLGDGTFTDASSPVQVSGITNAVDVKAGPGFSCALLANGTIVCWGSNAVGQLGNGTNTDSPTPVLVSAITMATAISANTGTGIPAHACATLTNGTIMCWGGNKTVPVMVSGITTATGVSTGDGHTCAVLGDGTTTCWGANSRGQLGNGNKTPSLIPVQAVGLANAIKVSVGGVGNEQSCAVVADGTIRCWGNLIAPVLPVGTVGITPLSWSSSDPLTATVDSSLGIVSGLLNGTALITASADSVSGSANVFVQGQFDKADVAVALSVSPNPIRANQDFTHTATVMNYGPNTAHDVVFINPPNVTLASVTSTAGSCSTSNSPPFPVTCNIGSLASGASVTVTSIGNTNSAGSTLKHSVSVTSSTIDLDMTNNNASLQTAVVSLSDLALEIVAPLTVLQGQTINYQINVVNNGPDYAAGDLTISGTLPTCSKNVSFGPGGKWLICSQSVTAWTSGPLTQTMTLSSGSVIDSNSGNNTVTVSTNVIPVAELVLGVTASSTTVAQGETVTYTISVYNYGPATATGVIVNGSLPSCNFASIAAGTTVTCTRTVTATTVGTLTQSVSVSGTETDPTTANNTASISTTVNPATTVADLALTMTDNPDPVEKGKKLVYTLIVRNNGPHPATNVSLTDTLPPNITFVSVAKTQGTCSGTTTISCALGTLNSGTTATVKITVRPKTTATLTNSASVSATEGDPSTANNSASTTTQVKKDE